MLQEEINRICEEAENDEISSTNTCGIVKEKLQLFDYQNPNQD